MHHHINHCWCSSAQHNNETYDAPNMVSIDKLKDDKNDWDNLIATVKVISEEDVRIANLMQEKYPDYKPAKRDCPILKEEIISWLNENIKPQKDGEPGWAMGDDQYRVIQTYELTLWFQRRNDSKKFIRTWSKFKKATSYFNYFDDPITNLVLDTETNKYKNRFEECDDI